MHAVLAQQATSRRKSRSGNHAAYVATFASLVSSSPLMLARQHFVAAFAL